MIWVSECTHWSCLLVLSEIAVALHSTAPLCLGHNAQQLHWPCSQLCAQSQCKQPRVSCDMCSASGKPVAGCWPQDEGPSSWWMCCVARMSQYRVR